MPDATLTSSWRTRIWPAVWRYGLAVAWWLGLLLIYLTLIRPEPGAVPWFAVADLVVGAAMIAAMPLRHRWPRSLLLACLILGGLSASGFVAGMWAVAHLATRRRWVEMVGFGALAVLMATVLSRWEMSGLAAGEEAPTVRDQLVGAGGLAVLIALVMALGAYVGARRDLAWAQHERAQEAVRRQETHVLQAQAEERNRIAREMHDVLAHRISLVSMHAGILAYRDDLPPAEVQEIAAVIQDNARRSMAELRTILGSLRQDDQNEQVEPDAPQPGFAQLPGLFADARRAGQRLEVAERIEHPELLPDLVGRHIYRVVQELISNARKHASDATARVELAGAPGVGVQVTSRNPVRDAPAVLPGAGMGLVGLRERAAVLGGSMSAGLDAEGWFEVKVWFPW